MQIKAHPDEYRIGRYAKNPISVEHYWSPSPRCKNMHFIGRIPRVGLGSRKDSRRQSPSHYRSWEKLRQEVFIDWFSGRHWQRTLGDKISTFYSLGIASVWGIINHSHVTKRKNEFIIHDALFFLVLFCEWRLSIVTLAAFVAKSKKSRSIWARIRYPKGEFSRWHVCLARGGNKGSWVRRGADSFPSQQRWTWTILQCVPIGFQTGNGIMPSLQQHTE